jgi:hypothetical protein
MAPGLGLTLRRVLGGDEPPLRGALAWIVGILALFVPLSVWRYRRMISREIVTPAEATAASGAT